MNLRHTGIVLLASAALALSACSAGKEDGAAAAGGDCSETGVLKVGLVGGITGGVAAITERGLNAAKLAIEQANKDGSIQIGCQDYRLEFVEGDDKYDVAEAANVMRRLIQVEDVDVIVGSYTSLVAVAEMEVAEQLETPFIITGATTSEIPTKIEKEGYEYVFMSSPTAPERAAADAEAVSDLLDPSRAYIVWQDTDWGSDVSKTFEATLAERNDAVDVEDEVVEPGTTNYGPIVAQIKNQKPDVVYAAIGGVEFFSFIEQMAGAGVNTKIFGSSSDVASSVFIEEMGDLANGVLGNLVWVPNDDSDLITRFSTEYQESYGELPADVEAQTYDGMLMLFDALNKAESASKKDIAAALLEAEVDGVRGHNKYNPTTHTTEGLKFIIGQIQKGEHVLLWPEDSKTGSLS